MEIKHSTARIADKICPQCREKINIGDPIKWVPRKFKAHHEGCTFTHHGGSPNNDDAPKGDLTPTDVPTIPISSNVSKAEFVAIARDVVTDATANILHIAESTAKLEAQTQAATYFDNVTKAAKDMIESIAPRRIELVTPDGKIKPIDGVVHHQFEILLRLVQIGVNVWLYGAAGGGKSTVAGQVAKALGLQFRHISLNVQSQTSLILGFINANGVYMRTPFRDVYEHGGVFLIDEIDAANGNFLTSLNTALANGSMAFPDGMIERHKDAIFIAASNTAGNGASGAYNTRNKIDAATRERFAFLKWEYDLVLETSVTMAINPDARSWFDWVQEARSLVDRLSLNMLVTPRASIEGAKTLKAGLTFEQTADLWVFKGIDADTRTKVLSNVPLPTAKGSN